MASLWEKLTGTPPPFSGKSKFRKDSEAPAADLPGEYITAFDSLQAHDREDIQRFLHIFNNDITPVLKYIDEKSTTGKSDIKNYLKFAHPKDKMKWGDYNYMGKKPYDMMYRKGTKKAEQATQEMLRHPVVQPFVGVSTGIWNTAAGIAELGAALTDVISPLDTDTLSKVEKAIPSIDLLDIYGDKAGSIAKFTSILVQYGLGFGIARKIATKLITRLAKTKAGKWGSAKAAKLSVPSLTGTKTGMDIAKFGGYWVLPAALGDALVSNQANVSLGDVFGETKEEGGNKLQQVLMNSKTESLEGLTGKKRAAAILRNKLKFAGEGAALFGGITLVGPSLKAAAKGTGKVLGGHTIKAADPASPKWGKLRGYAGIGTGKEIAHIPGVGDMVFGGIGKVAGFQTKGGYGMPALIRIARKGWKNGITKLGIPRREFWKFSDFNKRNWASFRRKLDDWVLAPLSPSWKFDKGSATAMRHQQNMVRGVKKKFDIFAKDLDRQMYGLLKAGFGDIMMQTRTAVAAQNMWNDVLRALKGQIKIEDLPKSLRTSTRQIRKMIDDQTKQLTPIIRDMDVREDLIKNIGKYLHTSYEIFKNSKWRADPEVIDEAIKYFINLMKKADPKLARAKKGSQEYKAMVAGAERKVNDILAIGRDEGFTPGMRLQKISQSAQAIKIPANIFKDLKNLPDEIANLLGKVRDPKTIILDTLVEQAHTIHSYNAYRDLARSGLGKWIFRNEAEYDQFIAKNNIINPRPVKEITVKKPYNMDLEDIFKNQDGTRMVTIPEMAKAISDQTLLIDQVLKLPFYKTLLAIKAGTQINKTVLSLMTQMRNITTASSFALANGHVGKGASVADNFEILWKDLVGKTDDPKKLKEILEEALEAGALDSSTIATELEKLIPELIGPTKVPLGRGSLKKTAENVVKKIKKGRATDIDLTEDVAMTTISNKGWGPTSDEVFARLFTNKGTIGKLVQKSIEAYQLGDNVWKLFGYQFTKSQLKPAFKNLDDVRTYFREVEGFEWNPYKAGSMTPGRNKENLKTVDDAIKEVSGLIVRDTYPNYSMVPRAVQTVRKIPFFGNFVGFTSEMWRNSYEILRRGTAEMASSNPYIRQMGARRIAGYMATVGTLVPVAYQTALWMTGVPEEFLRAYKERFGADFQKGHTLIPIAPIDPETKKLKTVDADTLLPYSDVQLPFKIFMETYQAGKKVEENGWDLFGRAMVDAAGGLLKPFTANAIWYETMKEVIPDKYGVARTKNGKMIADWDKGTDPFSSTLYHIYSKLLPTTLKSGEKIYRAFKGQINRSAAEFNAEEEVAATIAGFRITTIDPFKSMKYKVGMYAGELKRANDAWSSKIIPANALEEDFYRLRDGLPALGINKQFNNLQVNRYRLFSEAYKDVQTLRGMGFSERDILGMMTGRRAFSDAEAAAIMRGRFLAKKATVPQGVKAQIEMINRERGTFYQPSQFYDLQELREINQMWNNIPLNVNLSDIQEEIGVPTDIRFQESDAEALRLEGIGIEQEQNQLEKDLEKEQKILEQQLENEQRQIEKELRGAKPTVPIGTPPLDTEIFTASRVYPTNSGTIDATTGLTRNQTALLSPGEQEIAKRTNQGIGSLT